MKKKAECFILAVGVCIALLGGCDSGSPQTGESSTIESDLLTQPVEIICPWAENGSSDVNARKIGEIIAEITGQPVTVVNRTGDSGAVGFTAQKEAQPDGYTLGIITAELNTLPSQGKLSFTYEDMYPIIRMNTLPACIALPADSPFQSLEELIAYAREHPGELKNGNVGEGSIWHICAEKLELATGIELNHISYDGASAAVDGMMAGELDLVVLETSVCHPYVATGDIQILGIMAEERLTAFPEYSTCKELGYDIVAGSYQGIVCPLDVPDELKAEWERVLTEVFYSEEYQGFCAEYGLEKSYLDAASFSTFLEEDLESVSDILNSLSIKSEGE